MKVTQTHKKEFKIILTQGLNRQIRRMCEYLDYRVVALKRIRIMNVNLDVGKGQMAAFDSDEIAEINRLVETSYKNS